MTNAMIILLESVKLMDAGVLAGTGQKIVIDDAEGKREVEIPETIHTYQHWKSLGYQVKNGSKAIAKFPVWKYTTKIVEGQSEEDAQASGKCFLKVSSFFKKDQVEVIKDDTV